MLKNIDQAPPKLVPSSQVSVTKEVVVWLKLHKSKLIRNLTEQMSVSPAISISWLPTFLLKAVASNMIEDLIIRLEESIFDRQAATEKMLTALKRGAPSKSIEASVDLMVMIVIRLARIELSEQPALYQAVLDKSQYFANLVKSCLATAVIEYEKAKSNKKR